MQISLDLIFICTVMVNWFAYYMDLATDVASRLVAFQYWFD